MTKDNVNSEIWKSVPGWGGYYSVSNLGRVRNDRTGKIKSQTPWSKRYVVVTLYAMGHRETKYVHRLVAEVFLAKPYENYDVVNHMDGDKTNNRVENLEWTTPARNNEHAWNTLLQMRSAKQSNDIGILDQRTRAAIAFLVASGVEYDVLAKAFNVQEEIIDVCSRYGK